MQLIGIFKWRQHLKKETNEIQKIRLSNKERIIYSVLGIFFTIICYFVLIKYHDKNPIFDSITTIFSIFGLLLTVKRCIEQWYVWIVVNGLSAIMWIQAYLNGSNCFATVIMWVTYFILAVYFLKNWEKDIQQQEMN
jgi:nicotinamide mononucleotide transporter